MLLTLQHLKLNLEHIINLGQQAYILVMVVRQSTGFTFYKIRRYIKWIDRSYRRLFSFITYWTMVWLDEILKIKVYAN